jgi:hypothetical protein
MLRLDFAYDDPGVRGLGERKLSKPVRLFGYRGNLEIFPKSSRSFKLIENLLQICLLSCPKLG